MYQKPCALLIGTQNDYPLFGRVDDMVVVHNQVMCHLTVMNTLTFNQHFQAYSIDHTSNTRTISHSELLYPFPLHIHRISSEHSSLSLIVCMHHITVTLP